MKILINKIKMVKNNILANKFKKYIIKYEELNDKIKIINSNGDHKLVNNTVPNKIKVMEIIKEHKNEIENKINYYENKKEDDKIVILSSGLILIFLGCLFGLSFFFGSYALLFTTFISFAISLYLFSINTYKIMLFRSEVKRLKYIIENKEILNNNEIIELFKDSFIIIKNKFYDGMLKIISIIENIKVKNN